MLNKRLKFSITTGALLGVICIIGGAIRMGYSGNQLYLFALWYNRLLMGLLIGLVKVEAGIKNLITGAFLGLLVSLAFYLSTGLNDHISFLAGIVYGIIIAAVAVKAD